MFQGTRNPGEADALRPHLQARRCLARQGAAGADPRARSARSSTPTITCGTCRAIRYLLDELLADLNTGHNVVATVFEECRSMYRARGPEEMKPVGEVEFVAGVAAMSDSGRYGPARVCRGIVGYADLALGDRVAAVLEAEIAAGGGRFRGIRYSGGWDADPIIGNSHGVSGAGVYLRPEVRAGMKQLERLGLVARRLGVPSPARRGRRPRARLSRRRASSCVTWAGRWATDPMPARRTRSSPTGRPR